MMTAATIIQNMQDRGIHLAATARGTIKVVPAGVLTDDDRALLRKHKAEVLSELQGVNLVNLVNIDSGSLPPSRIVRDDEPMFAPPAPASPPDDCDAAERLAIQSESEMPPADEPDIPGFNFPDPKEAAQTLLETMRAIGLRVRLTVQGELRIGPQRMLWPCDRETIAELKPELIEILQKEIAP